MVDKIIVDAENLSRLLGIPYWRSQLCRLQKIWKHGSPIQPHFVNWSHVVIVLTINHLAYLSAIDRRGS